MIKSYLVFKAVHHNMYVQWNAEIWEMPTSRLTTVQISDIDHATSTTDMKLLKSEC